jgi:hypothetical protein
MSTTPSATPPVPSSSGRPKPPPVGTSQREIRIYSHTQLFYWWPVWAVGFILAVWTYVEGDRVAIVPAATSISKSEDGKHYLIKAPADRSIKALDTAANEPSDKDRPFHVRMSGNSNIGAFFVTVLLLVILITNAPLRGLWSVIVIVALFLLAIILALAGWWESIFARLAGLHIYINMAGYFFIASGVFAMWLASMLIFDRQTYMIFTPGQFKVCMEVGGAETAYDTIGMTIQKQRDDLFRHWILGLGSGDLIVRTSGANSHEFHMPNVLSVSYKLHQIEEMQRDRPTVSG